MAADPQGVEYAPALRPPSQRIRARPLRRRALASGPAPAVLAVGVLLGVVLTVALTHRPHPLPLSRAAALGALQRDPASAAQLRGLAGAHAEVSAVDDRVEQVNLYAGGRMTFEAIVGANGRVVETVVPSRRAVPYGNTTAYEPAVLALLAAVFLLVAGVAPLRHRRNADAIALVTLTAPVLLLQHGYVDLSVLAGALPLGWLAARCACIGLGAERPESPTRPLFDLALERLSPSGRRRIPGLLVAAVSLVLVMVAISSTLPVDVIYAVMEGATKLIHGVLPYGHLPSEVLHADTYPPLSYAAYAPLAAVEPVASLWDSVDVALAATAAVAIAAAAGAASLATGRFRRRSGPEAPATGSSGARAALALLTFPPLLAIVSTGTSDVAVGALLLLAIALWRRPGACGAVLAAGGWFKLAPFVLLPLALAPLRDRELRRALLAVAAVSAAVLAFVLALGGPAGFGAMVQALGYQLQRGTFQSIWHALGLEALQPFAIAPVLALVAFGVMRLRCEARDPRRDARDPSRDPRDPRRDTRDPRRAAALCAAVLIGLQLAAGYWTFLYLAWLAPLLVLALIVPPRPVLEARS